MSEYTGKFVSMICCGSLEMDEYISDMILEMKSRLRKLTDAPFFICLQVQDASGQTHKITVSEAEGFVCPDEIRDSRCTELPVEVSCKAMCEPEVLKTELHQAIADSSGINNMTPFFFLEEAVSEPHRTS